MPLNTKCTLTSEQGDEKLCLSCLNETWRSNSKEFVIRNTGILRGLMITKLRFERLKKEQKNVNSGEKQDTIYEIVFVFMR